MSKTPDSGAQTSTARCSKWAKLLRARNVRRVHHIGWTLALDVRCACVCVCARNGRLSMVDRRWPYFLVFYANEACDYSKRITKNVLIKLDAINVAITG